MDKYVFLEHTADVLFEAYGKSFEEALENAAAAMFSVISETHKLHEDKSFELEEKAATLEDLASFLLGDLVALSDANEFFFKRIKVGRLEGGGGFKVKCIAYGEPYSPEKGLEHVKAVTHHETVAEEKNGRWRIRILLDI